MRENKSGANLKMENFLAYNLFTEVFWRFCDFLEGVDASYAWTALSNQERIGRSPQIFPLPNFLAYNCEGPDERVVDKQGTANMNAASGSTNNNPRPQPSVNNPLQVFTPSPSPR